MFVHQSKFTQEQKVEQVPSTTYRLSKVIVDTTNELYNIKFSKKVNN